MEEYRTHRSARPKRNPLYLLFLGLCAAVAVLLITTVVLGVKLAMTDRALDASREEVSDLTEQLDEAKLTIEALEERDVKDMPDTQTAQPSLDPPIKPVDPTPETKPAPAEPAPTKQSWLDLSGHRELSVKPDTLYDAYKLRYVCAEGLNIRSGPGTSYTALDQAEGGDMVKAAAESGDWTLVNYNGTFGWVKSEYLSTTYPPKEAEATSGNLKR